MRTRHLILLGLLSGLLLTISWPGTGNFVIPIFFALVPLLVVEDELFKMREHYSSKRIFSLLFPGLFLWNVGVCFFIFYIREPESSPMAEFFARIISTSLTYGLNTCFMAFVFWLFHLTRRRLGSVSGYAGLVFFWLTFEYLHMHWSINWPWLNLGNAFAKTPQLVQWYEYVGSPGGTLWILLVNIFIFHIWKDLRNNIWKFNLRRIAGILLLIVAPIVFSLIRYSSYTEVGDPVEVVCVQPNLDPYEQKFAGDPRDQLKEMLLLMDSVDTDQTRFYLFPETALQESGQVHQDNGQLVYTGLWEHNYDNTASVLLIKNFLQGRNGVAIAGASDREVYDTKATSSARFIKPLNMFYDSYNSALLIDDSGCIDNYRKSKLVPGVESIPFSEVLSFLEGWALEIGGASGSLGTQKERDPFVWNEMKVAPTICYESVFGEFTSLFVKNGAQAIFISTNDAWWQSSPGYVQLMNYARLRAIENRRSIARSANTGISCFINQRGDITSQTEWLSKTAIRGNVLMNDELTFYTKHGDFISRLAAMLTVMLLLWSFVRPKLNR